MFWIIEDQSDESKPPQQEAGKQLQKQLKNYFELLFIWQKYAFFHNQ